MFCAAACWVNAARTMVEMAHFIVTEVAFDGKFTQVEEVMREMKIQRVEKIQHNRQRGACIHSSTL